MQGIIQNGLFSIVRNAMDIPKVGSYVHCGVYGNRKVIKRTKQRNKMVWVIVVA